MEKPVPLQAFRPLQEFVLPLQARRRALFFFAGAVLIKSVRVLVLRRVDRTVEGLLQADYRNRDIRDEPVVQE